MLIVAGLFLLFLAVINFRCARNWAYPPCVFCLVWSFAILLLWAFDELFFAVGLNSVLYFIMGAIAFSIGGSAILALPLQPFAKERGGLQNGSEISLGLDIGLALLVVCFPLYLRYMEFAGSLASTSGNNVSEQLRRGSMLLANDPNRGLRFEPSLIPLSIIFAVLAYHEYRGGRIRRWRTLALVLLGLFYTFASGARSEVMVLLVGLFGVAWLRNGRLPRRLLMIASSFFFLIFTVNQISLEKMNAQANASFTDNLPAVAGGLLAYTVGGLVAFDHYIDNPGSVKNQWKLTKPIARIVNRFGGDMDEPSRHLMFTKISPSEETNVYTVYFPFVEDGYTFGFLAFAALGGMSSLIFRYARRGHPLAVICYGFALYATVMSVFAEEFFARSSLYAKAAVVVVLLYSVGPKVLHPLLRHAEVRA